MAPLVMDGRVEEIPAKMVGTLWPGNIAIVRGITYPIGPEKNQGITFIAERNHDNTFNVRLPGGPELPMEIAQAIIRHCSQVRNAVYELLCNVPRHLRGTDQLGNFRQKLKRGLGPAKKIDLPRTKEPYFSGISSSAVIEISEVTY